MKTGHYWKRIAEHKRRLSDAIPHDELADLHRRSAWRHFAILARQIVLVALAAWAAVHLTNPLAWLPLSVFLGFSAFNFTVLLHEVVHETLFVRRRPRLDALMGYLYAIPSGISRSQFTRWHLDHHDELGSSEHDPKRHWLTPKVVKRWYKLLYCTPALFPIYFRAAARETRTYPEALQRRIRRERLLTTLVHVATMIALLDGPGFAVFAKLYAIPYFVVFPIAFTLNRLGQHYNIDPSRPLAWSTRMGTSWAWNFLFLYSNFHLEHHYFPRVPFYNLAKLNRRLRDFYEREGIPERSYGEILWGWFVENRAPHTDWTPAPAAPPLAARSSS